MNYPVWYLPNIGGGLLIAIIAITHVFVSHFAVGGGLYLVLAEKKAYKENNEGMLDFLKKHARFFLLITMVFGSISGVGIWIVISLVSPAATSILIHNFVFGWAAEWVFFVVEIVAAFVYYYTFGKMDRETHLKVGWVYFIAAWMSLFLINGIIDFMLTPGAWLENNNFWVGFFNPSFFPSLFFRSFLGFMFAGVYSFLTTSFLKEKELAAFMTKYAGKWILISFAGALISGFWYLNVLPEPAKALVMGKSPTISLGVTVGFYSILVVMVLSLILTVVRPALNNKAVAIIVFTCAFFVMGAFEWSREAARRPYAINEVIYSNSIMKSDLDMLKEKGFMNQAKWVQTRDITDENLLKAGEELFIHQCYACHTLEGFNNPIKALTANMTHSAMTKYINRIHEVRYFMPPFAGSEKESEALAAYLTVQLHGKELAAPETASVSKLEAGKKLCEDFCASCHELTDLVDYVADWDETTAYENLGRLSEINEDMPNFDGTGEERTRLAFYLYSLNNEVVDTSAPDGKVLFEDNCSSCHDSADMPDYLGSVKVEEIAEKLGMLSELNDEMENFEGNDEEKNALAEFLYSLIGGVK